ncbi:multiple epidermal growth factor-like domains protein 11 [Haliotis asinina]|uniref:multiple epidermal growth factor-like domains protein 11 n=1 Tax=Haliotis asinina TaxID=109174 RepID=UPI0035326F46
MHRFFVLWLLLLQCKPSAECEPGYYGADCRGRCSEGCDGGCSREDGRCTCRPGWLGVYCTLTCPPGFYTEGEACTQCGGGCDGGECDAADGGCNCAPGWAGYGCTIECMDGFFGNDHSCMKCSAGCAGDVCDAGDGSCSCKAGWAGSGCHKCKDGFYMDGQNCTECSAGCQEGICNATDGSCTCRTGWTGINCTSICDEGNYGQDCSQKCNPGCKPGSCHHATGDCNYQCKAGWIGQRCDELCGNGFYVDGDRCVDCGAGCVGETCNITDGSCNCKDGWTGSNCNECKEDFYMDGQNCTQCSIGCQEGHCNATDGSCTCRAGWTGINCISTCNDGTYGHECTQTCTTCLPGICHHVTGECDNQCKDGWTVCHAGTFGQDCGQNCNPGCKPWSCNHVTGDCNYQCKDGWTGRRCEHNCDAGTYGQDCTKKCNPGCKPESCHHVTGKCKNRCIDGWRGQRCDKKCRKRMYGPGCSNHCRSECRRCHHVTGSCEGNCHSGWYGENCSSRCPPGTYGQGCRNQCNEGCQPEKCDSASGSCGTSCRAGWTGDNCVDACSSRTYGENCRQDCSMGCVNQTCDRTTGRCDVCLDGWEHGDVNTTRCDKECDNGRYGENCKEDCSIHCINATCHHVNGSCTHGCLDGRSGEYCEISEARHQNVYLLVGLLLLLIVVITVVMCFVFVREPLRRFSHKKIEGEKTNGVSLPMAVSGDQNASEHVAATDEDEAIYVNVPSSVPVAVSAFKEFVARKKATKEILVKEYAELPKGLTANHDKAMTEVNSPKNRFKGIYPYNHSLVVLEGNGGSSGYINASYIDGRTRGKQYIATQGPLPETVVDFWEMIWQEQVPVIVMLANIMEDGRRRCEPYWPNEQGEDTKTFGPWKITVADSCPLADFTIRTLTIKKGSMQRTVKHVHYMVWPDKDVPDNTMSLVELRNKVRTFCDFAQGPMVVHCSAGVGRTGTLIALDSLLEDAETRNMVDIYGCVLRLRNCRVSMVQTQSQYVFLHDCLLDALCHTIHPTPASLYGNAYKQLKKKPNLAVAYQKLCECPQTEHVSDAARDLENIDKNRNKEILPGDMHRAVLTREADDTDYINAVIAPSYEKRRAFILTQIPLTSTVVDFWRLVYDYDVRGIVLLENYTDVDVKCGMFWAKDKKPTKFGPFSVSEGKIEEHAGFTMEKICYSLWNDKREVTLFRSPAWPKKSSLPESPSSLLGMIDFLRQWKVGAPSPLVVVCRDGATRSGLFCVLASAVQRLLLEKEVALQQTIRSIRFVRKQVIPNLEQFEFCYDSMKAYMDSFQEYSNFA